MRKNGVSIEEDFPLFANHQVRTDWSVTNNYVNSSPLNRKQYRFVSEETKAYANETKQKKSAGVAECSPPPDHAPDLM